MSAMGGAEVVGEGEESTTWMVNKLQPISPEGHRRPIQARIAAFELVKLRARMPAFCYLGTENAMAQVLVRDLDPATVKRLKERAQQHNRSLQGEAKAILEHAASAYTMEEARAAALRWQKRTARTNRSDSVELLRKDRER